MKVKGELDELMEENDWALIFDEDGRVKGVFIPAGSQEEDCPKPIITLLEWAGLDLETDGATIH